MIKNAERLTALLDIVEKITKVAPGHQYIIGAAMGELKGIELALKKEGLAKAEQLVADAGVVPGQPMDSANPPNTKPDGTPMGSGYTPTPTVIPRRLDLGGHQTDDNSLNGQEDFDNG